MNANAIPQKENPRFNRIKIVSRVVRWVVLANLLFNICFWMLFPSASFFAEFSGRSFLVVLSEILLCFWFWKLAQLFQLYERGLIFAAETIRCIKILGAICLCGWLTITALHFVPRTETPPPTPPPGAKIVKVERHSFGFLYFNFGSGIDFGLLFVGASVVVAAWIMDEGRKIQEEQELTV